MEDRLMDAVHRVVERIREDNFPLAEAARTGRRMLNYEARREETIERRVFGMSLAEEQLFIDRIAKKVEEGIAISLEKRIQKLLEEIGLGMKPKSATEEEYVLMPLDRRSVESKIREEAVQPPHEVRREKKIIVMDANHSCAKRKAVSPLEHVVNESTSTGVLKKTLNEDWSCALCQVTATSKHGLDDHFLGKKHKVNEAARKLKNERKNFNNVLSLKKKAKCDASYLCESKQKTVSPQKHVANEYTSTGVAIIPGEDWSCAICQFSSTSKYALDVHLQGMKHLSKETELRLETVRKNQDNGLLKIEEANQIIVGDKKSSKHGKRTTVIWCEICCVGVTSETVMEVHRKGKNHLKLLKDVQIQNINQIANTVGDAECGYNNSLKCDDTDVDAKAIEKC